MKFDKHMLWMIIGCGLPLLFIFRGAGAESKAEGIKHSLEGVRVMHVIRLKYAILNPDTTLKTAADHFVNFNEKSYQSWKRIM